MDDYEDVIDAIWEKKKSVYKDQYKNLTINSKLDFINPIEEYIYSNIDSIEGYDKVVCYLFNKEGLSVSSDETMLKKIFHYFFGGSKYDIANETEKWLDKIIPIYLAIYEVIELIRNDKFQEEAEKIRSEIRERQERERQERERQERKRQEAEERFNKAVEERERQEAEKRKKQKQEGQKAKERAKREAEERFNNAATEEKERQKVRERAKREVEKRKKQKRERQDSLERARRETEKSYNSLVTEINFYLGIVKAYRDELRKKDKNNRSRISTNEFKEFNSHTEKHLEKLITSKIPMTLINLNDIKFLDKCYDDYDINELLNNLKENILPHTRECEIFKNYERKGMYECWRNHILDTYFSDYQPNINYEKFKKTISKHIDRKVAPDGCLDLNFFSSIDNFSQIMKSMYIYECQLEKQDEKTMESQVILQHLQNDYSNSSNIVGLVNDALESGVLPGEVPPDSFSTTTELKSSGKTPGENN